MTLERPFDLTKATADSGHWRWVSLPQAVTINGHGNFLDCALIGGLGDVNGTALSDTTCNVTDYTVPPGGPLSSISYLLGGNGRCMGSLGTCNGPIAGTLRNVSENWMF